MQNVSTAWLVDQSEPVTNYPEARLDRLATLSLTYSLVRLGKKKLRALFTFVDSYAEDSWMTFSKSVVFNLEA